MATTSKRGLLLGVALLLAMSLTVVSSATTVAEKKVTGPLVSGTLSVPGYVIAAIGFSGKMTYSTEQSFSFRAPQSEYTLQLLTTHGLYSGPVVVGGTKTKAIVGLQGAVRLGTVEVVPAKGYAHLAKRLSGSSLVTSRWATAKAGVPIGNGRNLGLVASKVSGGGTGPGEDEAHIGIPNELNIAVPGKKELRALTPAKISAKLVTAKVHSETTPGPGPVGGCNDVPASVVAADLGMSMDLNGPGNHSEQLSVNGETVTVNWTDCNYAHNPSNLGEMNFSLSYLYEPSDTEAQAIFQAECKEVRSIATNYLTPAIGDGACVQGHTGGMQSSNGVLVVGSVDLVLFGSTSPDETITLLKSIAPLVAAAPLPTTTVPSGNSGTGGSSSGGNVAPSPWMAQLFLPIPDTVNVDASGVTQAEIDAALTSNLDLKLINIPTANVLELDCDGLSYCSAGGTGEAIPENGQLGGPGATAQPFPGAMTDPATGYGQIVGPHAVAGLLGSGPEFNLEPRATSAEIGSGDVITEIVTNGNATTEIPTTIDFVFETVPAIDSYTDTAGDSVAVTYPYSVSVAGSAGAPLKVAAGPDGDVVVTFTIFRPQRAGIPGAGEPAYMDIGNLSYALDPQGVSTGASSCPGADYSNLSPTLTVGDAAAGLNSGRLIDSASDTPASLADTISFSVDLTKCLLSSGWSQWAVGQTISFDLSANSQTSPDHSSQSFSMDRTS